LSDSETDGVVKAINFQAIAGQARNDKMFFWLLRQIRLCSIVL